MGVYEIACPQCNKLHLWFSGINDQRCEACMKSVALSLKSRIMKAVEFDKRGKELVTEYRYGVFPDADKDQLETLLADYACHGFEAGIGLRFDRLQPLLEALAECASAISDWKQKTGAAYDGSDYDEWSVSLMRAWDSIDITLAKLEAVLEGCKK